MELGIPGLRDATLIGRGGFAAVYRAFQPAFQRTVAVKILLTDELDDRTRRQFRRECHAMGVLAEHPGIVTVHDGGFTDKDRPYLVMAYISGGALEDRLGTDRRLPWTEAAFIGVRLAGALETAHRAHILHRDVKPANVLMSTYGALLSDFGIASIGDLDTRSGVVTASVAHAAPEVLTGEHPTVAADVYSLGSTLFTAMTGSPPFADPADESVLPMIVRSQEQPIPDLRRWGVPNPMRHVVERAMSKASDQRFDTALDLGEALRDAQAALSEAPTELVVDRALSTGASSALTAATPADGSRPPSDATRIVFQPTRPRDEARTATLPKFRPRDLRRRRRAPLIALLLLLAGVVVAAVVILYEEVDAPAEGTIPDATGAEAGGDLGVNGVAITRPPCDGSFITIVRSVSGELSRVRDSVAAALNQFGYSSYLRTDQTCPSLRQSRDGQPLYVVYLGPFPDLESACVQRTRVAGDAYVKALSSTMSPDDQIVCPAP